MPSIPDRDPITDHFTGILAQIDNHLILSLESLPATTVVASGELTVRYGIRYLGKPHLSIVPGLVALDYGDMLTGEKAWDFLLKKSNLHPRADVIGYRNDGEDEMIVVKNLDLALPVDVLIYSDDTATKPIASANALIASPDVDTIPARVYDYLPHYDTLDDWRKTHE